MQVMVEVDTTKEESFLYDPIWDEPLVTVKEADYKDWVEEVEGEDSNPKYYYDGKKHSNQLMILK